MSDIEYNGADAVFLFNRIVNDIEISFVNVEHEDGV